MSDNDATNPVLEDLGKHLKHRIVDAMDKFIDLCKISGVDSREAGAKIGMIIFDMLGSYIAQTTECPPEKAGEMLTELIREYRKKAKDDDDDDEGISIATSE